MKESVKVELDQKQKTKENVSSRTQKLFDVAKGIHPKIENSDLAIDFPAYEAAEVLKEYKIKADQSKTEAIKFVRRQMVTR